MSVTSSPGIRARPGGRVGGSGSFGGRDYLRRLRDRWNDQGLLVGPPRREWPLALRRAHTIGLAVLAIELAIFVWWSFVLTDRFSNTWDFGLYYQAVHLISVGNFNPFSTSLNEPFLRNAVELFVFPLAAFLKVFPHAVTLKVVQALALVGAQAVALTWIGEITAIAARRLGEIRIPVALFALGMLVLVANPWYIWTSSFDIHPEPFIALLVVAAARDLLRGRKWAWLWAGLAIPLSTVGATCVFGLGMSVALSGRCWWRRGAGIALMALVWLGFTAALHDNGSTIVYGYLATGHVTGTHGDLAGHVNYSVVTVITAMVKHPLRVLSILWSNHTNIWATAAATGLIGFFWPPVIVPAAVTLLEGGLVYGSDFSIPGDQNIQLAPLMAVGTVAVCVWLYSKRASRRRFVMPTVLVLLMVNAFMWGIAWFPQVSKRWLHVTPAAAAQLHQVAAKIGPNDEVISSQGIIGDFAARRWEYSDLGRLAYPVKAQTVWIILTPSQGIETTPVETTYAEIAQIARLSGAHLVTAKAGVWAFKWHPSAGTRRLRLHLAQTVQPAVIGGQNGRSVLGGSEHNWYAESTAKAGYTLDQAYWRQGIGAYEASVSLSVAQRANVEVWDASTGKLLARRSLRQTGGRETVKLRVLVRATPGDHVYHGWGIWQTRPAAPPPGDNLEIRVWSPGGVGNVKVYKASMVRAGRTT